MHDRLRTLSVELMLAFDDSHFQNLPTMPYLKQVLLKAHYDIGFDVAPAELEKHLNCVVKLGDIIENCCELWLELYKERDEEQ